MVRKGVARETAVSRFTAERAEHAETSLSFLFRGLRGLCVERDVFTLFRPANAGLGSPSDAREAARHFGSRVSILCGTIVKVSMVNVNSHGYRYPGTKSMSCLYDPSTNV